MLSDLDIGIVTERQADLAAFVARHPHMADRVLGRRPSFVAGRPDRIVTVHCRTGERTVEMLPPESKPIIVRKPRPAPVFKSQAIRRVVVAVCATWDVTPSDLLSHTRTQSLALPRFAVMRMLFRRVGWSLSKIGREMRRDHTSVMHGIDRAKELSRHNLSWRAKYDAAVLAWKKSGGGQ